MPTENGSVIQYAEEVADSEVMTEVIGTREFEVFQSLLGAMPEVDDLEAEEGSDIWDRMLDDGHVWGNVFQLKNRILSKDWDLVPPDQSAQAERVTEFVEEEIKRVGFDELVEHLLEATTHKYSVAELVWKMEGSLQIDYVKHHKRKFFGLDENQNLYFDVAQMEPVPPYKFVWFVLFPKPRRPYGRSLLKSAYWAWRFKQMGWESWSIALEKIGVPSLAALANSSNNLDKVSKDLKKIANGSSAALGNIESVEQVGGGDSVGSGGFEKFQHFCNAEISKSITTATLSVEEGRQDAERGDTEVHDEKADNVAKYVSSKLEKRIKEKLFKPMVFIEFGEQGLPFTPRLRYDWRERATWDEVHDWIESGGGVSRRLIKQDYNMPLPEDDEDAFVSPSVQNEGMFADPQLQHLADDQLEAIIKGPGDPPSTGAASIKERAKRELARRQKGKKKGHVGRSILPTPRPLGKRKTSETS